MARLSTGKEADNLVELRATIAAIRQHNREQGRPEDAVSGQTSPDWLSQANGLFKDSEMFEEAVRSGEAWRDADRPRTGD